MGFGQRELKGIQLAIKGHVVVSGKSKFLVKSKSGERLYEVRWDKRKWICTCEDFARRGRKCKHVYAVMYYLAMRNIVIGVGDEKPSCLECGKSDLVIKRGFAYERSGPVQRYFCKRCGKRFNYRSGFEGSRGEAIAIVLGIDLYFRGLSLRQVCQHLESVYGVKVSHATVYNWIKRYVRLVDGYLSRLQLITGERWHLDEMKVKVSGRHILIWSALDSQARILIAQRISRERTTEEAGALLDKALDSSAGKPLEIITDGLSAYAKAIEEKLKGSEVIHIQGPLTGPVSNNVIERYHRTLRQRFRSANTFHSEENVNHFLRGFGVYYNYIRPHSASSKPPAETLKIKETKNWLELIKKARNHIT
jgi:transposase-like protein